MKWTTYTFLIKYIFDAYFRLVSVKIIRAPQGVDRDRLESCRARATISPTGAKDEGGWGKYIFYFVLENKGGGGFSGRNLK